MASIWFHQVENTEASAVFEALETLRLENAALKQELEALRAKKPMRLRDLHPSHQPELCWLLVHNITEFIIHDPLTNKSSTNYKDFLVNGVYKFIGQTRSSQFDAALEGLTRKMVPTLIAQKSQNEKKSNSRLIKLYMITRVIRFVPRTTSPCHIEAEIVELDISALRGRAKKPGMVWTKFLSKVEFLMLIL